MEGAQIRTMTADKVLFLSETKKNGHRTNKNPDLDHSIEQCRQRIRDRLSDKATTYQVLSDELTEKIGKLVSKGAIYKFQKKGSSYVPTSKHLCQAFDIPHFVEVQACPRCGVAHVRKTCPNKAKPPKKRPKMVSLGYISEEQEEKVMAMSPAKRLAKLLDLEE